MTAHDPQMAQGSWIRWLRLGATRPRADSVIATGDDSVIDLRDSRHRRTLDDISRFLLFHRLPVSSFTLEAAHDIVTCANPALARQVEERIARSEAITLDWLEDTLEAQGHDGGAAQIQALVTQLETVIGEFGRTATAARTATTDYNSALEAHVGSLGAIGSAGNAIIEIANLARDMLQHTQSVERELGRSERETRKLQKNLADARREAEIDHLTGLPNRRAFEAVFKEEYAAARVCGESLCVAFCDIDEFKRVNDTHGHEAGDRVLRVVAQSLAAISDDKCHVARHGGEEFVVLLRDRSIEQACAILDEARETIAARKLINRANDLPFGRITFSAGVAGAYDHADARAALRAADEALLRAKETGRNRVLAAQIGDASAPVPGV